MVHCSKCGAELRDQARYCSKCGIKLVSDFSTKEELAERRSIIAGYLLKLIQFVEGPHVEQNKSWFERGVAASPPITDELWGNIAQAAGVYGRFMWKHPLDSIQKRGMWQALIWTVQYERYFRPNKVAPRFLSLLYFFSGCNSDPAFSTLAFRDIELLVTEPDMERLVTEIDPKERDVNLKKLREVLSKLSSSPVIESLCQRIDNLISTRLAPKPEATSPKQPSAADTEVPASPIAVKIDDNGSTPGPVADREREEDPLGFLNRDQRAKLLSSIRSLRLDQMRVILRAARKPLLSALIKVLSDLTVDEILPPRHSLPPRSNKGYDPFVDAKTRILSPLEDNWKQALRLFEGMVREIPDREKAAIAQEWLLFAQARVYGLNSILTWKENYGKRKASWEEIWNLAVASFRMKDVAQALDVLRSGVKERSAPFSHLPFALKCGVHILQYAESYGKDVVAMAVAFLLDNLTELPLPQCYLAWLLLAHEAQDPIDYKKQSYVLSIFQDILDRPIKILRPENRTEEASIDDFEKDFQSLLTIIQRLENNYILEPQEDRIGIKSKLLATFLRTPQAVPKRVGLFVDYENLLPLLPSEMKMDPKGVGEILVRHASQYGDVVCRWACADPRNIPLYADSMSEGFKEAGFLIQFPRGETGILIPKDNLTDFVLVERITFESIHSKPDIYIIVSGDGDYYEKIMGLLEEGNTVHLIASLTNKHLASKYRKLEQKSRRSQLPESYPGDFFIDNLDKILRVKV